VPAAIVWAPTIAVVALAIPRLRRSRIVEAGAGACLVGLAVSPHSLDYEAVMMVPFLMWSLGATRSGIAEPARTRLVVGAYLVAQLLVVSTAFVVSSAAVITFAATAIWITGWQRQEVSPAPSYAQDSVEQPGRVGGG
jgi:hypothetical protein